MAPSSDARTERGREASRPSQLGLAGWGDVVGRTLRQLARNRVAMVAAGVAFFSLLALFPALAAAVSIWGIVAEPSQIAYQLAVFGAGLPPGALEVLQRQAREIAGGSARVEAAALGSVALALFAASRGVSALLEGLNVAYNEREGRNLLLLNAVALGFTLFLFALMSVAAMVVAFVQIVIEPALPTSVRGSIVVALQGVVVAGFAFLGLAVLYRYGPSRRPARWHWASTGATIAIGLWVAGSLAFARYVSNFGSYNETYGTLAGVVLLLLWLWLSAFAILLGAAINNELERQTRRDTTVGPSQPMGERNAYGADTLGPTP